MTLKWALQILISGVKCRLVSYCNKRSISHRFATVHQSQINRRTDGRRQTPLPISKQPITTANRQKRINFNKSYVWAKFHQPEKKLKNCNSVTDSQQNCSSISCEEHRFIIPTSLTIPAVNSITTKQAINTQRAGKTPTLDAFNRLHKIPLFCGEISWKKHKMFFS